MPAAGVVDEARLEHSDAGVVAVTDGWFVVNVRDAAWVANAAFGAACIFESDDAPFPELGFTLAVLEAGRPSWRSAKAGGGCLSPLGARAPPRRRRRGGDEIARKGVRALSELATRAADAPRYAVVVSLHRARGRAGSSRLARLEQSAEVSAPPATPRLLSSRTESARSILASGSDSSAQSGSGSRRESAAEPSAGSVRAGLP